MNLTKIISYVFLVIALGLGYFLINRVMTAIQEEKRIEEVEATVINKLIMIREAQKGYQSVHGTYANTWENLVEFVRSGNFFIIERSEQIITLDYGADSVVVTLDTLGTVAVIDSLFPPTQYPNFRLQDFALIPGTADKRFALFTDKVEKTRGVFVDVIEVRDTAPINPNRRESNEARNRKPLRFGSRTDVTTSGNWE